MMEMEFNIIEYYFDYIEKHISDNGYFLNINRYEKKSDIESIKLADYPYKKDWEVLHSQISSYQPHVHYLLTQKTNNSTKQNIKPILKKIEQFLLKNPHLGSH